MHFFTVPQLQKLGIPRKILGLLLLHCIVIDTFTADIICDSGKIFEDLFYQRQTLKVLY